MLSLPKAAEPLVSRFSIAFTAPTFQRVISLLVGCIVTRGRRTVTRVLATLRGVTNGHFSDYHRVLSRAPWSMRPLVRVLAAAVLELVPKGQAVLLSVDDTATRHEGDRVYGKGLHRDNVRSTLSLKAWLWGHRWVVLAVNVKFPFAKRRWALPVLVALYKPKALNEKEGRPHRTPIAVARVLVSLLLRWFPDRRFILLGDGGYASHGLAKFCHDRRRQLTLVSLLHPCAHLCEEPPPRRKGRRGPDRIRGPKLPHPQDVVEKTNRRRRATVDWYGSNRRRVEYVTRTGHWYKATEGLVPIRWVFVHDRDGRAEDRYFYSTDPTMSAPEIIALYTARWAIEVTFQEAKQRLGLGTERNWSKPSVLRTGPCLLGLFSVVALIYREQTKGRRAKAASEPWYPKTEPTFSDALASVRRALWDEAILSEAFGHDALNQLQPKLRETLLNQLSWAA
jgi:DDE superfamily endonuclease/Archaeal putative transposase ISC1217